MYNEGNSVIVAHEAAERLADINEGDEGGVGAECVACGERTVETMTICISTNTPVTSYCISRNASGCLYKRYGKCLGHKLATRCSRCGEDN